MGRLEMVENRKAELEKLSDVELVNAIARYFENNHTMPGEKDLKDTALMLLSEFTDGSMTGLISQLRDTLIETFASVCVKTTKLKHPQAADSTKKNREAGLKLVDDLIMVRTGTYNRTVKGADGKDRVVTRDVYEMPTISWTASSRPPTIPRARWPTWAGRCTSTWARPAWRKQHREQYDYTYTHARPV